MQNEVRRVRLTFKTSETPSLSRSSNEIEWKKIVDDEPAYLDGEVSVEDFEMVANHPLISVEFLRTDDLFVIDLSRSESFNTFIFSINQFYLKSPEKDRRGAISSRVALGIVKEEGGWRLDKIPKNFDQAWRSISKDLSKLPSRANETYLSQNISALLEQSHVLLNSQDPEEVALYLGRKLYQLFLPYKGRMEGIVWTQENRSNQEFQSGNYHFRVTQPMHLECQRLGFFVAQGLLFERFPEFGMGIQMLKSPLNETLDLSFMGRRISNDGDKKQPSMFGTSEPNAQGLIDPGLPHDALDYLETLSAYAQKHAPEFWAAGGEDICSSSLIILDYAHRLGDPDIASLDIDVVTRFIVDPDFRISCIRPIPTEYFHQNSPLDSTTAYWVKVFKALSDTRALITINHAIDLLREHDFYRKAQEAGFSEEGIVVYSKEEHKHNSVKIDKYSNARGNEYYTKWRSYLDIFTQNGNLRYLAKPNGNIDWVEMERIFPNFAEPISMIRKMVKLSMRSKSPSLTVPPILLVGPPGLGKTFFASELAMQLGTEYHEISMATLSAGFILSGLDLSWGNSRPGEISEILAQGQCANPLVIMDELDKAAKNDSGKSDPFAPMYQLLEPRTAAKFKDEALRMKMDVSHFIWFATANEISAIPEPIISRFEVFNIPNLTREQIPDVAQSIYAKIRRDHPWGESFSPDLSPSIYPLLEGSSARDMFKIIRRACASASDRSDEHHLSLLEEDIQRAESTRRMGF